MSGRAERRAARETVGTYHQTQLVELVAHIIEAVDCFRAGTIDAFDVDRVVFQYGRAAKELWKFCNGTDVEFIARQIAEGETVDWWKRGEPRRRYT